MPRAARPKPTPTTYMTRRSVLRSPLNESGIAMLGSSPIYKDASGSSSSVSEGSDGDGAWSIKKDNLIVEQRWTGRQGKKKPISVAIKHRPSKRPSKAQTGPSSKPRFRQVKREPSGIEDGTALASKPSNKRKRVSRNAGVRVVPELPPQEHIDDPDTFPPRQASGSGIQPSEQPKKGVEPPKKKLRVKFDEAKNQTHPIPNRYDVSDSPSSPISSISSSEISSSESGSAPSTPTVVIASAQESSPQFIAKSLDQDKVDLLLSAAVQHRNMNPSDADTTADDGLSEGRGNGTLSAGSIELTEVDPLLEEKLQIQRKMTGLEAARFTHEWAQPDFSLPDVSRMSYQSCWDADRTVSQPRPHSSDPHRRAVQGAITE